MPSTVRFHVLALHVAQRREAVGHALIIHGLPIGGQLAHQHGAGAAVALAVADFGAGQVLVVAHEIEQRAGRRFASADELVVEVELYHGDLLHQKERHVERSRDIPLALFNT